MGKHVYQTKAQIVNNLRQHHELEWNRMLSVMVLISDGDASSVPAFELHEHVLTIHCDIYIVKTLLTIIN